MAHRHIVHRSAGGRSLSYGNKDVVNEYNQGNAKGVSATAAKAGNIKKAEGGKVIGKAAGGRLDKRARGGPVSKSPFSSAAKGG